MRQLSGLWYRQAQLGATVVSCLVLGACSGTLSNSVDPHYGVSSSPRLLEYGQPVPKGGGTYRIGPAYVIAGHTYVPAENAHYRAEGIASWYGSDFHGRLTANGEIYDMDGISAAHPTLPMPCYVRVTNLGNRRSMIVRINDRGPYASTREIDVSGKTAELLGFRSNGVARVLVEYVGRAPLEGSDDRVLMATLRVGAPAPAPTSIMVANSAPAPAARPALRGSIPMPLERPFDFGEHEPGQSGASVRGAALRQVAPRPVAMEERQAAALPVSTFAPLRGQGTQAQGLSQGLY